MEGVRLVHGPLAKDRLDTLCASHAIQLDMALFAVRPVLVVEWRLFHQVLLAVGALKALVVVRLVMKLYPLLGNLILACDAARDALA